MSEVGGPLCSREAFVEAVWSSDLKPLQRLVALAYARRLDESTGEAWVPQPRLLARTGMSRNTARSAIDGLVAAGWFKLVAEAVQHRAARYRLVIPEAFQGVGSWTSDDPQGVSSSPPGDFQRVSSSPSGTGVRGSAPHPLENQGVSSSPSDETSRGSAPDPLDPQGVSSSPPEGSRGSAPHPEERKIDQLHTSGSSPDPLESHATPSSLRNTPFGVVAAAVPDATDDEVRQLVADFAAQRNPGTLAYWRKAATSGAFAVALTNLRATATATATAERDRELDATLARLHATEPACEHGTAAGRTPHPLTGTPLCPACRRSVPARVATPDRYPTATAAGTAWSQARQAAGFGWAGAEQVIHIAAQARQLHETGGMTEPDLIDLATEAGRRNTDLIAEGHRRLSTPLAATTPDLELKP